MLVEGAITARAGRLVEVSVAFAFDSKRMTVHFSRP